MSSTPTDSRRRAEIEAKRAKLAELRRAKEERLSRIQVGRSTQASETATPSSSTAATASRKDLDDLVATLVGTPASRGPRASQAGDASPSYIASPRKSAGPATGTAPSEAGDSVGPSTTLASRLDGDTAASDSPRPPTDFVEVAAELFEYPQKEKVYYTKEVQTVATSANELNGSSVGVGAENRDAEDNEISAAAEAVIRRKILLEQQEEKERSLQEKLKVEEEELQRQIEEELRVMSPAEASAIFGAADFGDFVEQSSKVVERALTDTYDFLKDYTIAGSFADVSEGRTVKQARCFYDEKLCKGRSITGIDWSSKHPELVVASYSRSDQGGDSPDGLVLVWNLHLQDRPEFIFRAQTDVLCVAFSPFQPNIVIGGTYSGQILIWDTRSKQLPVLKTPLSAAGHTHPVYRIRVVGTQNAHHLITASTDGLVCSWMLDMLARPQDSLELLNSTHPKTEEVAITALDFPAQETTQFFVGTEEGHIYLGSRFDRAGAKAGLQAGEVYRGHSAPITGVDFHKAGTGSDAALTASSSPFDFSDLFLSSSMDWTAKLWKVKSTTAASSSAAAAATSNNPLRSTSTPTSTREVQPLLSFEETTDYVLDVKWHPHRPSLFALVDASGLLHIYDLVWDVERPVVSLPISAGTTTASSTTTSTGSTAAGLNKVSFDRSREGRFLACGGVAGRLHIMDLASVVQANLASDADGEKMQRVIARLVLAGGTNAVGGPASSGTIGMMGGPGR